ncbi:hypothetical protein TPY_1463 [Sulfobacillus acidophilus TPY]|uniref:Uncharacterized protein n=1 Tax=Sulfobacillus acidophilus (strain ATCC 700253 / DSM 10332 / NAL) TaxID=679936 RepID=G8U0H4_SULAD|nr:hypothetical protein TPY_1463 [Sulfobacillus acidophilus TPY]AEW04196.1 hypothetical protein Sulac_0688 [Sulfobacillus acidophilus DSM 10332]
MSTRGFVGIGTAEQWTARYNHADSYPTGLGPDVWATAQRFWQEDHHLDGFAQRLLSFTDWRQMATDGVCEYCGQRTGQPHSISGTLFVHAETPAQTLEDYRAELQRRGYKKRAAQKAAAEEWPIIQNIRRTGYPDPEARYHPHDSTDPAAIDITPQNVDWLFMEWGYIVDPDRHGLHVFVGMIPTPVTYTVEIIRANGTWELWTDKERFTGALVGTYDLTGPEPDWEAVEQAGYAVRDQLEDAFAANPDHPLLAAVRRLPPVEVWDRRPVS